MEFKENFKRICSERNTYPTTVIKKLGLSTSKVSRWNAGALPKEEVLNLLAKELDCSVMDFFAKKREDYSFLKKDHIPCDLSEDEKDVIEIFRKLDRKQKHDFMAKVYEYESSNIR